MTKKRAGVRKQEVEADVIGDDLKKMAVVTKKEVAISVMTDGKETLTQVEVDVIGDDDETGGEEGARVGNGRRTP